jgi:hypothetical protein
MICSQVLASAWDFGNVENFALLDKSGQSGEFGNSQAENSPRRHISIVSLALNRSANERRCLRSHDSCVTWLTAMFGFWAGDESESKLLNRFLNLLLSCTTALRVSD